MHELSRKLTAEEWKELEVLVAEKSPAAIERVVIESHGIGRTIAIKAEQRAGRAFATLDADDVAGEVVIRAIKYIARWEPSKRSLRSWVWTIAIHAARAAVFRERKRWIESCETKLATLTSPDGDDHSRDGRQEAQSKVRSAIQSLPARWRETVCHRYGIDTPELQTDQAVSDTLGISRPRVSEILGEARRRLAQHLARNDP